MKKLLFVVFAFVAWSTINAQTIPSRPSPPRLVNDFAGIIDQGVANSIEQALVAFNDSTSTQITIITVNSLEGTDAADFAHKLGQEWGIGQKDKNNGIVILVKPKIGNERGHAYIAVGYGLEGVVPDAIANRIVDLEMIPHFKKGNYTNGIVAAASVLMDLTKGEYTADQYSKKKAKGSGLVFLFFAIIVIFIILRIFSSGSRDMSSKGSSLPFWLLLGGMASSSRNSGGFGGFSSGSGGFGGFGGGGFGGGGAGSSW